jgi:hypothetical protein
MRGPRKHCFGFILATAMLGACAVAQTSASQQLEEKISTELRSGNPQQVAWAAHDALSARDQNLLPELLSLAEGWQPLVRQKIDEDHPTDLSPLQLDQRDAMAAVLDALIQMHADVPSDTLRILAPDFGNQVAVLLSRMPVGEMQTVAFDLYRLPAEQIHGLQDVSAALLAQHPVPGFAAHMIANVTVRATIFVTLPGAPPFGQGFAGDCFGESDNPRKGWPLTGQYQLTKEKTGGALVLVSGSDPIYAVHKLSTRYTGDHCSARIGVYLGPEERTGLIAEMLGISRDAISWKTNLQTQIEFESPEQFEHALLAFAEQEQEKHQATVAALAAHGLLTASEAVDSLPQLQLRLDDMRGQGLAPLQTPTSLPPHVDCSLSPF